MALRDLTEPSPPKHEFKVVLICNVELGYKVQGHQLVEVIKQGFHQDLQVLTWIDNLRFCVDGNEIQDYDTAAEVCASKLLQSFPILNPQDEW
jgi:hypothetical protein